MRRAIDSSTVCRLLYPLAPLIAMNVYTHGAATDELQSIMKLSH